MNIYLIGFMGTGKTSAARHLTELTGLPAVDTDSIIEDRLGMSTNEIFSTRGEEFFRNMETEILRELAEKDNLIVACGGGIVLKDENIHLMKESGKTVLLTAQPETILKRLEADSSRPLLKQRNKDVAVITMMNQRKHQYEKAADIIIKVDSISPSETAHKIIVEIKKV